MTESYAITTADFATIIDYIRFGVSQATASNLFYGHGTDNTWDEIVALVLGSLSLPLDCDPIFYQARLTSVEKQKIANQSFAPHY